MLINITNHPFANWQEKQKEVALLRYNEVFDLEFPHINPLSDSTYIHNLAKDYFLKCQDISKGKEFVVHVMGEFTFVFAFVSLLLSQNIEAVASTTERKVVENSDSTKTIFFDFVQFRNYFNYHI